MGGGGGVEDSFMRRGKEDEEEEEDMAYMRGGRRVKWLKEGGERLHKDWRKGEVGNVREEWGGYTRKDGVHVGLHM